VKKKISVILAAIALQAFIPLANAQESSLVNKIPYNDLNGQTVYLNSILELSDRKIINGNPDGTFRPDNCVNRAEFLKMLFVAQGVDINDMSASGAGYIDLDSNAWYYPYVKIASAKGTVNGYPDGTFRPGQCVNRVEAIKMMINEFGNGGPENTDHYFDDIDKNAWYYTFLSSALSVNLVPLDHVAYQDSQESAPKTVAPGTEPGIEKYWYKSYFYPEKPLTRKEAAEMINRNLMINEIKANLTNYDWVDYPQAYTYSPYITEFDSCGPLTDYSDKDWYPALIEGLKTAGETTRAEEEFLSTLSEGCLAIDGYEKNLIISLNGGYFEGNARIFKFNTIDNSLNEAQYFLFDKDQPSQLGKPFVMTDTFGQRNGLTIPMEGSSGDAGGFWVWKSAYHYNENAVYLKETCGGYYDDEIEDIVFNSCESTGY